MSGLWMRSEVAFAFCHLLGTVGLMPRLKRIKYERPYLRRKGARTTIRIWRAYLPSIRWDLIEQQYDELVKAAVALKRGTATAEAILNQYKLLQRDAPECDQ